MSPQQDSLSLPTWRGLETYRTPTRLRSLTATTPPDPSDYADSMDYQDFRDYYAAERESTDEVARMKKLIDLLRLKKLLSKRDSKNYIRMK